jgi:arylsulfatase A-like enzyme
MFSSDNGGWVFQGEKGGLNTPLRGGKGGTYEDGMCVPTIAWRPGVIPEGATCNELTAGMDLLPTFAAMSGGKTPNDRIIDGHDITPLLTGRPGAKSPWKHFFYYFGNELHAVRSGKWKFRAKNILKNENIYNKEWRETAVGETAIPPALYNLAHDPGEQRSVLGDRPKIAARLRGYMDEARADLGDSLVGKAPANARPVGKAD